MDGGRILFESAGRINEAAVDRIRKGVGRPGDVLLSHKGTVGKVAMAPMDAPPFVCSPQTTFWRVLDQTRIDRQFLYAYLRSPEFHAQLAARKGETDMADYVSLTAQRQLKVWLPELPEQRSIGEFVGILDSRIDLQRQTSATLESIGKALFKSWFIDFDPVRAKQAGREPEGLDPITAAFFPSEFEESTLGLIPKGWKFGKVEDLLILQRGFDLPSTQRTEGQFVVFAASGPNGTHHQAMVAGPGVTTGRSGVLGNVFYVHESFWPLNTSLWVKEFKAATPPYAYQLLKTLDLKRLNAGSAVPTLNRNHVHAQPALVPPGPIVSAYTDLAEALLARRRANELQVESLVAARDTLLPRLISGKLRLTEAQAELEEAIA